MKRHKKVTSLWWRADQPIRALGVERGDLVRWDVTSVPRRQSLRARIVWPARRPLRIAELNPRLHLFTPLVDWEARKYVAASRGNLQLVTD